MMDLAPDRGEKTVCDERLWAFIKGDIDPAEGLLIAAHCCLCPEVSARLRQLMTCAASVMETRGSAAMQCTGAEFFERNCRGQDPVATLSPPSSSVPKPLRALCGDHFDAMAWQAGEDGFAKIDLAIEASRMVAMLYRVMAGGHVPEHYHPHGEIVLVLSGLMRDEQSLYKAGEVCVHRADTVAESHAPQAVEDSYCLVLRGKSA